MGMFGRIADGFKKVWSKIKGIFAKGKKEIHSTMGKGIDRFHRPRRRDSATFINVNGAEFRHDCKLGRRHFTYLGIDGLLHVGRKGKPYRVAPMTKLYSGGVA